MGVTWMVCNFVYYMRIVLCELIDTKDIVIMHLFNMMTTLVNIAVKN